MIGSGSFEVDKDKPGTPKFGGLGQSAGRTTSREAASERKVPGRTISRSSRTNSKQMVERTSSKQNATTRTPSKHDASTPLLSGVVDNVYKTSGSQTGVAYYSSDEGPDSPDADDLVEEKYFVLKEEKDFKNYDPYYPRFHNFAKKAIWFCGGIPAFVGEGGFSIFAMVYASIGTGIILEQVGINPDCAFGFGLKMTAGGVAVASEFTNGATLFEINEVTETAHHLDSWIHGVNKKGVRASICTWAADSFSGLGRTGKSLYVGGSYGLFVLGAVATSYGDVEAVKDYLQDWFTPIGGNIVIGWLGSGALFYCYKSFFEGTKKGIEALLHPNLVERYRNHKNLWVEFQYKIEGGTAIAYRAFVLSFLFGRLAEQWELDDIPWYYTWGGISGIFQGLQYFLAGTHKKIHDHVDVLEEIKCDVIKASSPPELHSFAKLDLTKESKAAFVRYSDQLFYVNKVNSICKEIKLSAESLHLFDSTFCPTGEAKTLSEIGLDKIFDITGERHADKEIPISRQEREAAYGEKYGDMSWHKRAWEEIKRSFFIGIAQSGLTTYFMVTQVMPQLVERLKESGCPEEVANGVFILVCAGTTILSYVPHYQTGIYIESNKRAHKTREIPQMESVEVEKTAEIKDKEPKKQLSTCAKITGIAASIGSQVTRVPSLIASLTRNRNINSFLSTADWVVTGGAIGTLVGDNRHNRLAEPSIKGIQGLRDKVSELSKDCAASLPSCKARLFDSSVAKPATVTSLTEQPIPKSPSRDLP